jgi:F420-dependent oxidoreductase-like protein
MRIGLQVVEFNWPKGPSETGARLAKIAKTADEMGFASLWVMDHYFQLDQMIGPADDPMLEAYSTLSYLAGFTKNIKLGTMVTGVVYRHPGHLVKTISTLDVLSGGRAYLGIGAAWYEREAIGLGFPFPPLKERYERLEETLQIAKQMFSGRVESFEGKHYRLKEMINSPLPLTKPHPPILIGGMGEKRTLRLVAKYADACNLFAYGGIDVIRLKLQVLEQHCKEVGRPFDKIERTVLSGANLATGETTPDKVIESCQAFADAGIQHVIFNISKLQDVKPIEILGNEILPAVADL